MSGRGLDGSWLAQAETRRHFRHRAGAPSPRSDLRTESERDRGRLAYSAYLRRLAGVAQVVSPELTSSRLHSRSSHTHKVALVAREIAEHIARMAVRDDTVRETILAVGGLDVAACEAAGLAHDLGHPPFGHAGEQELNRQLRKVGVIEGFEGNAQSFRIVTRLDQHGRNDGLDLSYVTLCAILKYPWLRDLTGDAGDIDELTKFGAYRSEEGFLRDAREALFPGNDEAGYRADATVAKPRQSLEASIMDLADDIAYSIHDLEDFCAQDVFDLIVVVDKLRAALPYLRDEADRPENSNPFVEGLEKFLDEKLDHFDEVEYGRAVKRVLGELQPFRNTEAAPSPEVRDGQLRAVLSRKISKFFAAIQVRDTGSGPIVQLEREAWHDMQVLKLITKHLLVKSPAMGQIQVAQKKAIELLFTNLVEWLQRCSDWQTLPSQLQRHLRLCGVDNTETELGEAHYRAIADYICGMSDSEALMRSQWYSGTEIPGMTSLSRIRD